MKFVVCELTGEKKNVKVIFLKKDQFLSQDRSFFSSNPSIDFFFFPPEADSKSNRDYFGYEFSVEVNNDGSLSIDYDHGFSGKYFPSSTNSLTIITGLYDRFAEYPVPYLLNLDYSKKAVDQIEGTFAAFDEIAKLDVKLSDEFQITLDVHRVCAKIPTQDNVQPLLGSQNSSLDETQVSDSTRFEIENSDSSDEVSSTTSQRNLNI